MFIIEWFASLDIISLIFVCIAIPATLVLIIQTIMMFIGAGAEANGMGEELPDEIPNEMPDDIPDDIPDEIPDSSEGVFGTNDPTDVVDSAGIDGLKIFTVRGIIAFLVMFGWVGAFMNSLDIHLAITVAVATVSGFAMMVLLAFLFKFAMKLRNDGNTDNRNAIGVSGRVYLTVPAERRGEGKVHIMLQGSYIERDAVTDDGEPIETGSEVLVIGISGQTTLVVKRK